MTTLKITDERARLEDRARGIDAIDEQLPPERFRSSLYDLALEHLLESHGNLERAREDGLSNEVYPYLNTSVLGIRYRTWIE